MGTYVLSVPSDSGINWSISQTKSSDKCSDNRRRLPRRVTCCPRCRLGASRGFARSGMQHRPEPRPASAAEPHQPRNFGYRGKNRLKLTSMKLTILDGYCLNPGDLSWDALRAFGQLEIFDRTR